MLINVLMSTYNGEAYIYEQIHSILNQENVNTIVSVRDDGSQDNTADIIKKMMNDYPDRIKFYEGENLGYARSFLELLKMAENADYYAFADQDDYWLPSKLSMAIECLGKIDNEVKLYTSSLTFCDENLKELYINRMDKKRKTLKSDFIRHCYAGCTMVFSKKLRDIVSSFEFDRIVPSHDFVVSSVALSVGEVYVDPASYILHRRSSNSVTSKGTGFIDRIKVERMVIHCNKYENSTMAKKLLTNDSVCRNLTGKNSKFLTAVASSKIVDRFRLIFDNQFTCGILICDLESRYKILLGNY